MNDIDFNELDKAVNSLMDGKNQKPAEPAPAKVTTAAAPAPKPAPVALKPVAVPARVIPAQRGGRLPARPTGVVKTIVDIMAPKNTQPPSRVPSRIAPDIRPISLKKPAEARPPVAAPAPHKAPAEPEEAPLPVQVTTPVAAPIVEPPVVPGEPAKEPMPEPTDHESAWPDPIDFETRRQAQQESSAEKEDSASPFIPGAKVEKRPLGAFATTIPEATVSKEGALQTVGSADEPELDLPGYESTEKPTKPSKAPEPSAKINESPMMSIPAQYKTADKKTDATVRPVFDTKEYHTPLLEATNKPAHKGKYWLRAILTIVIILLIAVGGYLAYLKLSGSPTF
ncbi:MAG TPA: hypothetical protein VNG90_00250 [Candidatus Acidoferrum sp.]|nr:hypothetical protein [Candidatus Acidoferrum sp.]